MWPPVTSIWNSFYLEFQEVLEFLWHYLLLRWFAKLSRQYMRCIFDGIKAQDTVRFYIRSNYAFTRFMSRWKETTLLMITYWFHCCRVKHRGYSFKDTVVSSYCPLYQSHWSISVITTKFPFAVFHSFLSNCEGFSHSIHETVTNFSCDKKAGQICQRIFY